MGAKRSSTRGPVAAAAAPPAWDARRVAWTALLATVAVVPLVTTVFALPLFGTTITADRFDLWKVFALRVGVVVAVAAWAWSEFAPRGGGSTADGKSADAGPRVRLTRAGWPVLGLVVWAALSTVTSIDPALSVLGQYGRDEGLVTLATYGLLFFVTLQLVDGARAVRGIARVLALTSVPVSLYGLMQFAGVDPVPWENLDYAGRAFATYGNPEPLGGFLMFSLPVAAVLALSEEDERTRAGWWAVAGLSLACLVATFTRAAWVGAIAAVALLAFAAWRARPPVVKRVDGVMAAIVAGALAVVGVVSARSGDAVANVLTRLSELVDFSGGSGLTRLDLWGSALDAARQRPVLGFGPDTFDLFFPTVRSARYFVHAHSFSRADNAHGQPLQLASTIGVPGALLYGAAILVALFVFVRFARGLKRPWPGAALLTAGFAAGAVGYTVFLLASMSTAGTTFLLWIALAVIVAPAASVRELTPTSWHRPAARVTAVVAAVLVVLAVLPLVADRAFYLTRRVPPGDQRIAAAARATALAPNVQEYRAALDQARAENARNAILAALERGEEPAPADVEAFAAAIDAIDATVEAHPWFLPHREFQLVALVFGARYVDPDFAQRAESAATAAILKFPTTPSLYVERARARALDGRVDDALADLERARGLDVKYPGLDEIVDEVRSSDANPGSSPGETSTETVP